MQRRGRNLWLVATTVIAVVGIVSFVALTRTDPSMHPLGRIELLATELAVRVGVVLPSIAIRPQAEQGKAGLNQPPIRIWPIGDSITEGLPGYSSYRYWLWRMLAQAHQPADFVGTKTGVLGGSPTHPEFTQNHNAYSGYRAEQVLAMIRIAGRNVSFDAALIHVGTNDLGYGEPTEQIVQDLSDIVAAVRQRNPTATIFVAEIIPTAGDPSRHILLNRAIRAFAPENSTSNSPIISVDQFTGFNGVTDTYDGLHPTEAGEQKIAGRWFEAIRKAYAPLPKRN